METVIKEKLFLFVLEGLEEIFFYAKGGLKNINLITAIQFWKEFNTTTLLKEK